MFKDENYGKQFNYFTTLEYMYNVKGEGKYYNFRCKCGTEKILRYSIVKNGKTKSCGCYNLERLKKPRKEGNRHINGKTTRLYRIYNNMKQRCLNNKNSRYKDYGCRGIKICSNWLDDFKNFYDWAMTNGYSDELTIDRIDNDGNYEPTNCRWATDEIQSMNNRNNVFFTVNGFTKSLKEWAILLKISHSAISKQGSYEEKKIYIENKLKKTGGIN